MCIQIYGVSSSLVYIYIYKCDTFVVTVHGRDVSPSGFPVDTYLRLEDCNTGVSIECPVSVLTINLFSNPHHDSRHRPLSPRPHTVIEQS